ncbi:alpha/beta hydrolase family protein [Edaphobacter aggregans]|uniref:alpha/beta hydrolase family protein n=1 Tax=Edaphobacter aggregans TaxID=570835 RepID=UPI00054D5F28|nr:alpha/beta hydrolase family protein [Edaphobacter aggregans]
MLGKLYAKWMYAWETALTTRDTNRVVRSLEWGEDWLGEFLPGAGLRHETADPSTSPLWGFAQDDTDREGNVERGDGFVRMVALNESIVARADEFFGYETPSDFRLEHRHPLLFPTNVRPETLAQDAEFRRQAEVGEASTAEFLRFTSPVRTRYPENDVVNARWYPAEHSTGKAKAARRAGKPKQAMIVMPQWNADAFSHNALCTLFNRFGVSALRLSKPYHDIRRPAELERSDYAVSSNIGRTIAACQQAVVDIRSCIDWLAAQGYEQFGVLGTSLGSLYAFIAAAFDPRIRVCAFNHASTWFGDVVWTGQSTRHIRASFEREGLSQADVRKIFTSISPMSYMERFAAHPKRVLVVHATYDLTFIRKFSLDVLANFDRVGVDYVSKVLPCGHYTTGETPYQYMDGWFLGSFVYQAFKRLAEEGVAMGNANRRSFDSVAR